MVEWFILRYSEGANNAQVLGRASERASPGQAEAGAGWAVGECRLFVQDLFSFIRRYCAAALRPIDLIVRYCRLADNR